jgi:endonuclease-3
MGRVLGRLGRRYDIDRFVRRNGPDPYRVLVGCVLSLRTKDEVSYPATERLFGRASTPSEMLRLRASTIARLIYPTGFYRRKAGQIREISRCLSTRTPEASRLARRAPVARCRAQDREPVVTLGFGKPASASTPRAASRTG